jgi:hypothetical protein
MKRLSFWLALSGVSLLIGCADPLEQRSTEEVGDQLQKGLTGQGKIVPQERDATDPAGAHSIPETHP